MNRLTPREIVSELDKYIVGQSEAKKMVAIALRNRYRRSLTAEDIREDITPKNILMIGPTGVGKTEIARRLAKIVNAPFIKIEATKFTEVGYVGRDVESIIRDLIEESIRLVRNERIEAIKEKALELAKDRVIEILEPIGTKKDSAKKSFDIILGLQSSKSDQNHSEESDDEIALKRQELRVQLEEGLLDDKMIDIQIEENNSPPLELIAGGTIDEINFSIQDVLGSVFPKKSKTKKVTFKEAIKIFEQEEANKLIDIDEIHEVAVKRAENDGIIFIDEIDKIAGKGSSNGPDISREGVQRDILPIVEGSTINTKYGQVKTDYMLFIAAGAFHMSKVTDLIPELQGRFPVNVELKNLTKEDFTLVLSEPKNALVRQYVELLKTEGVDLKFTRDGIEAIADYAYSMNMDNENIGARRLHTIVEKVLMDISFEAPEVDSSQVVVDEEYVVSKLKGFFKKIDMKKYII